MQQIIIYILKVIVISGMLLLYYNASLRNKRFHYYNRFYLLITVLISLVLPLLRLQWFSFNSNSSGAIKIYQLINSSENDDVIVHSSSSFNYQQLITIIFITVCTMMLLHLIMSIIKIYKLKEVYPRNTFNGFDFIYTDLPSAPFSFFKNIFWRNDIDVHTANGNQILQHEIAHINQKHSLDKICMQIVLCICWINPFFWWLKKELYLIHEFIADEKAVSDNNAASFAQMLLITNYEKFEFLPAQSIFYSSIKRRLIMLTTSKKTQFSYLRRIMVLPLIAAVVCLFAFTVNMQNTRSAKQNIVAAKTFKLVVDAGHGGKDDGAIGNGLYEKNITLKIAKEIRELSHQYNIEVVLTRGDDIYMSPQEKSAFANAQNANAFISVHVNTNDAEHPNNSGFEVYIPKRNEKLLSNNQLLASAILQNINNDFKTTQAVQQRRVGIWILENSVVPSALIECGYITNANDLKLLSSNEEVELMARNILQGVAMYANNKVDKSNLYKIQNRNGADTNVPIQSNSMQVQPMPLYVVDGKVVDKHVFNKQTHDASNILSINVLKGSVATNKFGDKGNNGVIEVTLKDNKIQRKNINPPSPPPVPPVI